MTDEDRVYGCNPSPHSDLKGDKDKKDKVCDIDGICCNGFVKEQFTAHATAQGDVETVVYNTDGSTVKGTVKVKNLSRTTITFFAGQVNIPVGPFDEAMITSNSLERVRFNTTPGCTAKALFCFEIILPTDSLCCSSTCACHCTPPATNHVDA